MVENAGFCWNPSNTIPHYAQIKLSFPQNPQDPFVRLHCSICNHLFCKSEQFGKRVSLNLFGNRPVPIEELGLSEVPKQPPTKPIEQQTWDRYKLSLVNASCEAGIGHKKLDIFCLLLGIKRIGERTYDSYVAFFLTFRVTHVLSLFCC